MKKRFQPKWIIMIFTLVLSVVGFFVRYRQLATELLPDGGLAPGSHLHIVLIVLTLLLIAGLTALLLPLKKLTSYERIFTGAVLPNAFQLLSALGLIFGNTLLWIQGSKPLNAFTTQSPELSNALLAMLPPLGLLSALCIAAFAILRLFGKKPSALLYIIASVYLIVRLIVSFQSWTIDPSIHDYCFQLLAAICCMLCTFQLGGFCLDRGKRRMCLFWALSATVFCSITLADVFTRETLKEQFISLSLLLFMIVNSLQLLNAKDADV